MLLLGGAILVCARQAAAQESEPAQLQAAAESLFLEGRKLMAAGQTEAACQRFAESRHLEPAIGTTMNLARCYLKLGRTASAWLLYRETAASARALGQLDREQHAREELAAIEPDLAKVAVAAEASLTRDARVEVMLDGARIPTDSELPVDPGSHRLSVRTPRTELWSTRFDVLPRQSQRVQIPHLAVPAEPDPVREQPSPSAAGARAADGPPKDRARPSWLTPRRTVALTLAGAAVLGAGYATLETVRAASANADSDPDSCKRGMTCTAAAIANREKAFDRARRADIAAAVSGACLVGAGILWFLGAPPDAPVTAQASASGGLLSYRRSW